MAKDCKTSVKKRKAKKEYSLEKIIPLLSEDKLNVAHGLIDDALFMEAQLKELRKTINENGCSEKYQYGSKQTAAVTTYLQMQKLYGMVVTKLIDLMPKTDKAPANVSLLDWVNSN